jgi:galactokinase
MAAALDLPTALTATYGDDAGGQRPRYRAALAAFAAHYGPGPAVLFRAPGRVNLIGEHTDYHHGLVLPVSLSQDVLLLARPRADAALNLVNAEAAFPPRQFRVSPQIPPGPRGDWGNYARGAARELALRFGPDLRGIDALVAAAPPWGVPRGAGLSSSSALTVAVAVALAHLNGLDVPAADMAALTGEAEWYVGTRGGVMDQFAALLGRRGCALFLDCRPQEGTYRTEHVPLPAGYVLLVAESGVRRRNIRSAFNLRVAEGKIGARLLQARHPTRSITHLRDVSPAALGLSLTGALSLLAETLPERAGVTGLMALGLDASWLAELAADYRLPADAVYHLRARCRHVVTENERVLAAVAALRAGDAPEVGRLLNAAHASMRDDYAASCPQVDALVSAAQRAPGCTGARLTGAGWGGCAVALVEEEAIEAFRQAVTAGYRQAAGLATVPFVCRSGDGGGLVARANAW